MILRLEGKMNIAKATRGALNYPQRALKLACQGITSATLQTHCSTV